MNLLLKIAFVILILSYDLLALNLVKKNDSSKKVYSLINSPYAISLLRNSTCGSLDPPNLANGRGGIVFFTVSSRGDGVGSIVYHLVASAAFAYNQGWNFAGMVAERSSAYVNMEHNVLDVMYFKSYFGQRSYIFANNYFKSHRISTSNLVKVQYTGRNITDMIALVQNKKNLTYFQGKNKSVWLHYKHKDSFSIPYHHFLSEGGPVKSYWSHHGLARIANKTFQEKLRNGASCAISKILEFRGNFFDEEKFPVTSNESVGNVSHKSVNIAVHVRLGDVMPWDDKLKKFIPMEWYTAILAHIKKQIPLSKIHIFTSIAYSSTPLGRAVHNKRRSEFVMQAAKNFTELGYTVHISKEQSLNSTEEVIHTTAHFAKADVLITAKSDLGIVSGYLNPRCVVFIQDYGRSPLAGWIALPPHPVKWLEKTKKILSKYLSGCLKRVKS